MYIKFETRTFSPIYRKLIWPILTLAIILAAGTVGYWIIGYPTHSLFDGFYMTVITVSTIGFEEVIDLSNNVPGRVFTILLALSGVGVLTYSVSQITAALVEGEFIKSLKRKKMMKLVEKLHDHYIVCGIGSVGENIVEELHAGEQPFVIVEMSDERIEHALGLFKEQLFIQGDATENEVLLDAGVEKARGLFASTENDNHNLVICFTARQLNPRLKIVANCREIKNKKKIHSAGADVVISPAYMGGFRMALEMVSPNVVSSMDALIKEDILVEEILVPPKFIGKTIYDLQLEKYPKTVFIAVKNKEDWSYNPPKSHIIQENDLIILMTSGEDHEKLKLNLKGYE
ncbi:MAG: potassium channel protein [SAR324 cluster bacterium]|nr:potassium channel protein [SAR324 cluster bacterium]